MSNWEHVIYTDKNNKFRYSYSFYEPVINSFYATNICIEDEISCISFFNYYLFKILNVDENYKNQILSFSLMKKKKKKRR